MSKRNFIQLAFIFVFGLETRAAENAMLDQAVLQFRQTLNELVKADTTSPPGNEARAVAIIAKRLESAGVEFEITEFAPGRQNIVARLQGRGRKKALMLLSHLDVVGVQDQKWTFPPHEVTEHEGFLYGRGVLDNFSRGVVNLEVFLMLKKSGIKMDRDVILAFTGDEEASGLGLRYLLQNRPDSVDAGIALNEGGGLMQDKRGVIKVVKLQVAEKTPIDLLLTTRGETGHSSVPKQNNSIYRMAAAIDKVSRYQPERFLLPMIRDFFREMAAIETPELAKALRQIASSKGRIPARPLKVIQADPILDASLYTSCVPTMISGGIRANALPPEAQANINCRLLPSENFNQVKERIAKVIADPLVEIKVNRENPTSPASPTDGEVPRAVAKIVDGMYPGVRVVPFMTMYATDARLLRARGVDTYGLWPLAFPESDMMRMHGIDERIPVASIRPGIEFMRQLVFELVASDDAN